MFHFNKVYDKVERIIFIVHLFVMNAQFYDLITFFRNSSIYVYSQISIKKAKEANVLSLIMCSNIIIFLIICLLIYNTSLYSFFKSEIVNNAPSFPTMSILRLHISLSYLS